MPVRLWIGLTISQTSIGSGCPFPIVLTPHSRPPHAHTRLLARREVVRPLKMRTIRPVPHQGTLVDCTHVTLLRCNLVDASSFTGPEALASQLPALLDRTGAERGMTSRISRAHGDQSGERGRRWSSRVACQRSETSISEQGSPTRRPAPQGHWVQGQYVL